MDCSPAPIPTSHPPDICSHDEFSQAFPIFCHSSTSVYYCQCNRRTKATICASARRQLDWARVRPARSVRQVRQIRFWPYHFLLVTLRLEGVGYTVGGQWHQCSACMQFEMASCSRFVVPQLPPTPHQPSAGFPQRAFNIDFFHSVMSGMTRKAEISDSPVQSMTVLREPIHTTEN